MKAYPHTFVQVALDAGKLYKVSVALLTGKGFLMSPE
jgi:hypothetical protein